jgi:hypothetical protein
MSIQLYRLVYNVQNNTHRLHLLYVWAYNYIASCSTCTTTHIVSVCFMYEHTTILSRVQRVKQHTSSTSVICMSIHLYILVYNVCNNTHRLSLFYVWAYNYIISCTACKTTRIVYICYMYEHTSIYPRVQRVQQHT